MSITLRQELGQLFVAVARLHRTRADQIMGGIGLFSGQAFLLNILAGEDGITHTEVSKRLQISPAATTKVIKRMEEGGYLSREADPSDDRVSRVFLSDKGRAAYGEIDAAFRRLDEATYDGFTEADLRRFRDFLARMWDNLSREQF
jgi:DNA-binding MarR family transcriptional regulator